MTKSLTSSFHLIHGGIATFIHGVVVGNFRKDIWQILKGSISNPKELI